MKLLWALAASLALAAPSLAESTKATYYGLFSEANQPSQRSSGSIAITTTSKGSFTGKLQINGARVSFKGTFDSSGKASVTAKAGKLSPLQLELQLDQSPAFESITGTISDGAWSADLSAHRAGFDGKGSLSPQSGNYTLVIPDRYHSAARPGGYGYATVSVTKAGRVKLAGTLADGTKISQAATLSKDGQWPFYVSLYTGDGCAMSWLVFNRQSQTDLSGSLGWIKPASSKAKSYPAGFTNEAAVLGCSYHAPASGARLFSFETGDLALGAGNLETVIVNHVAVDGKNRVKNLSDNKLSLTFTTSKGKFRGKVTPPGASKPISFGGAVMQSLDSGSGCFMAANQGGFVRLRAAIGDIVKVQTLGSLFEPLVEVAVSPQAFSWSWSDGTSSSDHPAASKSFGSSAARDQLLSAYPAGLITGINLGFDGSDGATNAPIANRPQQQVGAVYFPYPLTGLRYWASSYNPITNTLDFTEFLSLEDIECFHCTNLPHVAVANLPSLRRLCLESCSLQELDISGDPNLEDVRAALNSFSEIKIGGGTGPKIWHFCVRDNSNITQDFQTIMTNFFSLREPWFWNANQSGALKFVSTNLTDVELWGNTYTSADFSGQGNLEILQIQGNSLTNLVLNGCTGLQFLEAENNQLTTQALDSILAVLDTSCPHLYYVDLRHNPGLPSASGYHSYTNLINKGVSVGLDFP